MTKLNYSVFVGTIKPAFTDPSMTNITRLLFGFLDDCPEIVTRNKQTYIIDNLLASNWCNQKVPIPKSIRKAVQQPDIRGKIVKHFEDSVYYEMTESTLDGIFTELVLFQHQHAGILNIDDNIIIRNIISFKNVLLPAPQGPSMAMERFGSSAPASFPTSARSSGSGETISRTPRWANTRNKKTAPPIGGAVFLRFQSVRFLPKMLASRSMSALGERSIRRSPLVS